MRERTGLTQRQIAQALQISDTYVSHWERGARLPPPKYRAALLEVDERALLQAAWESHRMREEKRPARAAAAELKA
nr:MAG TPA: helix-turn-helix domain protein [Caudoviricetes sp.]